MYQAQNFIMILKSTLKMNIDISVVFLFLFFIKEKKL